jgi:hypothetical protein
VTDPTSADVRPHPVPEAPVAAPSPMARRFLMFGGAAAAGSAIAAVASSGPASAGHNTNIAYDSQTTMHLDVTNTTAGSTRISSNISGTAAFVALNDYPVGISRPDGILGRTSYITSNCAGVAGTCEAAAGGIGVMGATASATGTGVYAYSGSVVPSTVAPAGTALYASGPQNGVVALARSANGVALTASAPAAGGKAAVLNGQTDVVGPLSAQAVTATSVSTGALTATKVSGSTVTAGDGLLLTRTAGRATVGGKRKSIVVTGVPVTTGSVVVATLQKQKKGLYVAAAAALSGDRVKITFNKKAPKGTVVGWVVVN